MFYADLTVQPVPGKRFLPQSLGDQIAKLEGVDQVEGMLIDCIQIPDEWVAATYLSGDIPGSLFLNELTIMHGRTLLPGDTRKVIIGYRLADRLQKKIGENISILQEPFEIVGIYDSYNAYENGGLVIPLIEHQALMGRGPVVEFFGLRAKKPISEEGLRASANALRDCNRILWRSRLIGLFSERQSQSATKARTKRYVYAPK